MPQAGGVRAGRRTELPPGLTAELRRTVVADAVGDPGDVAGTGGEQQARFLSRICFWNRSGLIAVTAWKFR